MQSSERTTRSSKKFASDQMASTGPEGQSDTGQYLCIECSETFNTRLELNSHRQSHVTKKQFMCTHCGRGFHHQVFLQMHERSHEDEGSTVKTSPARVISTRSSKLSDVVHVKPPCMKPQRLLNSIVEFKSEPKVCQTFPPREFVTRRSHGAASPVSQNKDGPDQKNLFELRISKFSDTTVHLVDSFGNSIEILANVFNTYTIGEPEGKGVNNVDEPLKKRSEETPPRNASGEMSSQNLTEKPSVSSQTKPTETDSDLPPGHEEATSEIISEKLKADDPGLPEPVVSNLGRAGTAEHEKMENEESTKNVKAASCVQPSGVPPENVNRDQTVDSAIAGTITVHAEDHMDTSPQDATNSQELRNEPEAVHGVDQTAECSSTADQPISHTDSHSEISIAKPSVEISNISKDQSSVEDPGSLKDAAEENKQPEEFAEVKQNPNLTLIPRVDSPKVRQGDFSALSNVSAYSAPLERHGKQNANLCNTLAVNIDSICLPTEKGSMQKKGANEHRAQNENASFTLPASEDDSEKICVGTVVPRNHDDMQSVSIKEKNIHLETDICMASRDVGDVSMSDGEVCSPERTLQVDNKDSENHCSLLTRADVLPDDELVIDDKRDDDLFERDIFPLEAPMEGCEKGLVSIDEQNIVCGGEAHNTKIVQEKDSDICLNGSDMTYISESEMIKLLEQDKDDITDDEPISTSQKDLGNVGPSRKDGEQNTLDSTSKLPPSFEKNAEEVQHYQTKLKTTDHICLTSENHAPITTLQASSKMDTDSCLPASLLAIDEPRTGDNESQNSIESMLTQESVSKKSSKERSFNESSSSSKLKSVARESNQNYEPCDSSSGNNEGNHVGDSTSSRTKHTHDSVTPEENSDVFVTVEDECDESTLQINHEKPHPSIPAYNGQVPATVGIQPAQTKTLDCVNDTLPSRQKEVCNLELDTDAICNQKKVLERKTTPVDKERESSPLDVLDYMQSTSDNDDDTNAASSQRADLNNEGMLKKPVDQDATFLKKKAKCVDNNDAEIDKYTQEQTTDLSSNLFHFSKSLPTTEDKSKETGTNSSIIKDVEKDLEIKRITSPKTIKDDILSEVKGDKGSAKLVSAVHSSVNKPVCQDSVEDALDDSELMDNEENADSIDTPSKAFGSGGECLKCGRKLRRSRKELVWFPECFKCRKAAKRQERLSSHELADSIDLTLEPLVSKREESLSDEFPGSHIKHHGEGLQQNIKKLVERNAQGSSARKMFKCPKCDKAFRLPALLAGHMKCHTLPQCLGCGCQMQLKYKTKRIPKRCQKCFLQLKKIKAEKKVREDSGDEDSDTSDGDVTESLADINPDDLDDEEIDFKKHKELSKTQETDSSDELDTSDHNLGLPDGEKPRLCPQCSKAFPCNRSFKLHMLSHTGMQCESCGCRLPKKRRVGRSSKKCRSCRLHIKDKPFDDTGDEPGLSSNKLLKQKNMASLRLKAKQTKIVKNTKLQSIMKKKKELKWLNMLLAVKGLMDKSRKKKENALKAADAAKKDGESSEAEKCDTSSIDNASVPPDYPDLEEAGSSKLPCPQDKTLNDTPKRGRKCLYKEKNIIKVEESEVLPYMPTSAISTAFIKKEETWQCLECNQSWPNSEALVNHQHSHVSGQSFTCTLCPQVFSSEQYLNIHIPAHDDDRPFRCPECDKTFTKRNHLGVHMRVHSGLRPYACPDCSCRFRQKVTLIAHRYSHRNYQLLFTKPFQCSVCSKSFKQKERLVVHERLHTGECPFSCKDCDKVFPSKARLYVHRKMHKICESESSTEQTLGSDEVLDGQPFKCQDCGKVCSTKASFVLHRKVHRLSSMPLQSIKREQSEDVHPFTCTQCNKVFSTKGNLVMHLKNHSAHKASTKSEKNLDFKECFPCKVCDKVCFTKASLALHRKVHKAAGEQNLVIKEESDSPSYICKDCNKVCSTKKSLVLHRKMHKIPKGTDTETPPFRCKDCDMVCSTKASFALHRKVHRSSSSNQQSPKTDAELQSYNCKHCDMVCSTKASFALHSKVHKSPSICEQKLKPDVEPQLYNCKHCDMVCSTKASFVLHSKVHKSPSISEQNFKADLEPQSYNCKHCDVVCSSKASFILHSKIHRPLTNEQSLKGVEEPQLYNCKHCDMVCTTKASFALHNKVHRSLFSTDQSPKTSEESQSYSCKHCDMVCSTKASFVLHSKVHGSSLIGELSPKAPEEPQSYNCKECDMVCSTKASFALHCKVHRSGQGIQADMEENAFTCSECNKVCSTKASFILHCKVHKSSNSEQNLGAKGEKARPFHCKECGKFFTSKGRLLSHRLRLHESSSSHDQNSDKDSDAEQPKKTSDEKPYACTICELRFAKLKVLVRHKAVHGERSVTPCIHCGKRFLYMKSLFNHIKICQSKSKGKKLLPKKVVKRKIPKDASSTSSDGESVQKKRKTDEKQKALTAAQKLKNKSLTVKAKKATLMKEKGKGKTASDPKIKEKRTKLDSEASSEGEGKKTLTEKQSDGKQEKPTEQAAKEPTLKKNLTKIKKVKKELANDKRQKVASGGPKKWRVLAASTVKKKNLQAVLIGGKKKLLMKKKVQVKPKTGGKTSKD